MRLLIAQLRNQDPLDPLKPEEFMGQLIQLQSLVTLLDIHEQIEGLSSAQRPVQPLDLLGRRITWTDAEGQLHEGSVEEVRMDRSGLQLVAGSQVVRWGWVQSVR